MRSKGNISVRRLSGLCRRGGCHRTVDAVNRSVCRTATAGLFISIRSNLAGALLVNDHARRGLAVVAFAENASAGLVLHCSAFITVMQATEMRNLNDPSDRACGHCLLSPK